MRRLVKRNAGWELAANISLIPIPVLVFITDIFITRNMGAKGPFLFFAYLTHIKDCVVIGGVAVPDIIRAIKAIKTREIQPFTEHPQSPQSPMIDYHVLDGEDEFFYEPVIPYEITDVAESKRTTVRVVALNLSYTATVLFFILVLPFIPKPETPLEKAYTGLVFGNHSWDTTILIAKFVRYNTPLHTSGTTCQRVMKEYVLPLSVFVSYAVFLYGFQALGGTNENGEPLYKAIDYDKDPESAAIMTGALAIGMPVVSKLLSKCLEAIQYCIHSPAGSVKNKVQVFRGQAGNCLDGVGRSVYNLGSSLYNVFTCRPCRSQNVNAQSSSVRFDR